MKLSPKDQKWLDEHEHLLPDMRQGERVGRKKITYFEELQAERLSPLQTGYDDDAMSPIGSYACAETLFRVAVRVLRPIEAFVLSRMCAGLKQREIAKETGIRRPNIARMIKGAIQKLQKPMYQNNTN